MPDIRLPVMVLSDFLGAGKTALLNQARNGGKGQDVAVIVNDMSMVNIDVDVARAGTELNLQTYPDPLPIWRRVEDPA